MSQEQKKRRRRDQEQSDLGSVEEPNLTQPGKKQKRVQFEADPVSTPRTDPPTPSSPTTQRTDSPVSRTIGSARVDPFRIIPAERPPPPKPADNTELAFVYQTGPPPVRYASMGENKTGFKALLVLQKSEIFDPTLQDDANEQNSMVRRSVDEYMQRSQRGDDPNVTPINSPSIHLDLGGQKILCCYWESVEYTMKVFKGLVRKY